MPDRKRFYDDPKLDRLTTSVVAVGDESGRPYVRLDETIFYPEGGGQPSDRGRVGEATVLDVQTKPDGVRHYLDRAIPEGRVETALDLARRFDHCQQHTAQHLLTAVLLDRHALPTTSFHLGADHTAIEVAGPVPQGRDLRRYEREVNAHLREDRRVTTRWVEPDELASLPVRSRGLPAGHSGPVRLVEIEGLDLNTCGGTHVEHLRELQTIEILDAEAARGGARIRFLAGERVLHDLDRRRDLEEALRSRLGTSSDEFASVVGSWGEDRKRLDRRVKELETQLAAVDAAELAKEPGPILVAIRPGWGPEGLRVLASQILARRPEVVVVLAAGTLDAAGACFLVQAGPGGPGDVAAIGVRVRDLIGAKGGGKGAIFQGRGGSLPALETLRAAAKGEA